jgi:hypothetical protein
VLFQITQVPVVQTFWLLAIAYLISGRWPTGVPPAWRSGRAEPWPSSAQMRAQRAVDTGDRRQRGAKKPQPVAAAEAPDAAAAAAAANERTRATTSKRKRKRRN